jgi:hypothetical protein
LKTISNYGWQNMAKHKSQKLTGQASVKDKCPYLHWYLRYR